MLKRSEIVILVVCGLSSIVIIHGSRLSPYLAVTGFAVVCGLLLWGAAALVKKSSVEARLGMVFLASSGVIALALHPFLEGRSAAPRYVLELPPPPGFTGNLDAPVVYSVSSPAPEAPAFTSACDVPPGVADLCGMLPLACRAEKGDAEAEDSYALQSVEAGDNECRDVQGSLTFLRRAAQAGHPGAQRHLAELLSSGEAYGVTKNDAEAARWLRVPAQQGDAIAQDDLGYLFETGRGVRQDFQKAYFWFGMAEGRVGGVTRTFAEVFDVPFVAPGEVAQHRAAAASHLSPGEKALVDERVERAKPR